MAARSSTNVTTCSWCAVFRWRWQHLRSETFSRGLCNVCVIFNEVSAPALNAPLTLKWLWILKDSQRPWIFFLQNAKFGILPDNQTSDGSGWKVGCSRWNVYSTFSRRTNYFHSMIYWQIVEKGPTITDRKVFELFWTIGARSLFLISAIFSVFFCWWTVSQCACILFVYVHIVQASI